MGVLILIVVEDGLVQFTPHPQYGYFEVLILIVVEDGLVPLEGSSNAIQMGCLNPYCSGRWSRTSN